MKEVSPPDTSELAHRVFQYQVRVYQFCLLVLCILPCLILIIILFPEFATFMATGPQRSSMVVIKSVIILAPGVLVFVALVYVACLLAAILNVFIVRLFIPELRPPHVREALLQFYSDPRWLHQGHGSKRLLRLFFLWNGAGGGNRLFRLCQRMTVWAIGVVYINV